MRIINNTDVNELILFSKKNLGIYKLVYFHSKKLYWNSIFLLFIFICLLVAYIICVISKINSTLEYLSGIICFLVALGTLYSLNQVNKRTKEKHLKIQSMRFRILKKYYIEKGIRQGDIRIINELLQKKLRKLKDKKLQF